MKKIPMKRNDERNYLFLTIDLNSENSQVVEIIYEPKDLPPVLVYSETHLEGQHKVFDTAYFKELMEIPDVKAIQE